MSALNTCVICGANNRKLLAGLQDTRFGSTGRYSVAECRNCGTLSTFPRPTTRVLGRLYERYYNFGGSGKGRYERLREAFHRSPLYRFWLALDGDIAFQGVHGEGRLLEVGCNEGRNLELYLANGFDAEGQEINSKAAELARRRGFYVHAGPLNSLNGPGSYDVVVLANVLEHAPNPVEMLRLIRGFLKPGGELWISLPNNRSWLRRVFGRKWLNWHPPFHLWHFGEKSLKLLLANEGFQVKRINFITPALWVAQSIIVWLFARPGVPTTALKNSALIGALMMGVRFILFPALWIGNVLLIGDGLAVQAVNSKEE